MFVGVVGDAPESLGSRGLSLCSLGGGSGGVGPLDFGHSTLIIDRSLWSRLGLGVRGVLLAFGMALGCWPPTYVRGSVEGGMRSIHDVNVGVACGPKTSKVLGHSYAGRNSLAGQSNLFISKVGWAQNGYVLQRNRDTSLLQSLLDPMVRLSCVALAHHGRDNDKPPFVPFFRVQPERSRDRQLLPQRIHQFAAVLNVLIYQCFDIHGKIPCAASVIAMKRASASPFSRPAS